MAARAAATIWNSTWTPCAGLAQPPGLGHRLDRDTSGCLALGRHRKALRRLGRIFSAGGRENLLGFARRRAAGGQRVCDRALHKVSNARRGWRMVVDTTHGKAAATDYRCGPAMAG